MLGTRAQTLLILMVTSVADVRTAVAAAQPGRVKRYFDDTVRQICPIARIETQAALVDCAALPGVGGLFVASPMCAPR